MFTASYGPSANRQVSVLAFMKLDGILKRMITVCKFSSQYIVESSMNPETGLTTL